MELSQSFSRRRFVRTLAAAGLLAPGVAHAAKEKTALEILVDKDGWGSASPLDIRTVLFAGALEIWRWCPGQLLRPIRVYHREDFPQTDFLHDWRGRIRIGLASEDTRWAQMAFQFGHEFCHALAQHSAAAKRSWHPPRHANLWFEECLCETGSLFVLQRLANRWRTEPPYPQWRSYASALADYASDRLARPDHQIGDDRKFPEWFRNNEAELRENAMLRARNVIIARQLLPLFEGEPIGWGALGYLNLGQRQHGKPLAQHLTEWRAASPAPLRPFIGRIAALFGLEAEKAGRNS
jgi:hypothetical protein